MTPRDILIFLFKWKWLIAGLFAVAFGTAALLVMLLPPTYEASTKVLVERNRPPIARPMFAPAMEISEALNNASAILLSRAVMEQVVDELQPHLRPRRVSWASQTSAAVTDWLQDSGLLYAQPPRERWIELLQKQVKVKPSIDASVLKISFGDEDPQAAADIVNAVVKHYLVHHVEVYSIKGSSEFLKERLQSTEAELRRRRAELADFRKKSAAFAIEESRRELVRQGGVTGEQIATAQTELNALLLRFEPQHKDVQLGAERLRRLKDQAEAARRRLETLESSQSGVDALRLEIAALETDYRDYSKRYEEARMSEVASASLINVSAIDRASVPSRPPNSRLFLLVVAAAGSLLLALMVALLREYFDRRLADPESAEDVLGVPDLGSVPLLRRRELAALHVP